MRGAMVIGFAMGFFGLLGLGTLGVIEACQSTSSPKPAASSTFDGGSCRDACQQLQKIGCVVTENCETILSNDLSSTSHFIRNAKSGDWLTCGDISAAQSVGDLASMGQNCGLGVKR